MKAKSALISAAILAAGLAGFNTAQAASSVSGTIDVKMVIGAGCVVSNAIVTGGVNQFGVVDFGEHPSSLLNVVDAQSTGAGSASTIQLNCTSGVNYSVGLNDGLSASGGLRYMAGNGGISFINYELYKDAARTNRWGAIGSGAELIGTGTSSDVALTIYGRVPNGQTPPASTYTDTVIATIAW